MRGAAVVSLLFLLPLGGEAIESKLHGNPIRRVVTMLQEMQKSVEKEGATEKELYDKYMCYCDKTSAELGASIEAGNGKTSELTSQLEEDTAAKSQLDQDVSQHKADREEAQKSISEATAMREKEAMQFATESGEMKSNIAAVDGALRALRKGLGAAMLQSGVGNFLKTVVRQSPLLGDAQREVLTSFLQNGNSAEAAAGSGGSDQILGILETMLEEMQQDLAETTASEESSVKAYQELMTAKNAEVSAATKAIESKMGRSGELAVAIATAQEDLEDTTTAVAEDTKMKANLAKSCADKTKEFDKRRGTRAEEITALSETVKILNADDSLDTFKKTMPSPAEGAASFLQIGSRTNKVGAAKRLLRHLKRRERSPMEALMLLQVRSKVAHGARNFDQIVEMIEKMVVLLKREQGDDDKQKAWCNGELEKAASDTANTRDDIKGLDTSIERDNELIDTVEAEIRTLKAGIADLDTAVAQATDQRKQEHAEYTSTASANQAALDLLDMAKNRMNKFYNPTMYNPVNTPPPSPYGLIQEVDSATRARVLRAQKAGGVLQLLAQMMGDVEQDMAVAKTDELAAQTEYEEVMADATAKRGTDSKLIVTKETLKADLTSKLDDSKSDRGAADSQLQGLLVKTGDLHSSCDFLLDNYDVRKEARTAEIEGLTEGKAVLSSAGGDEEAPAAAGFLQRS